MVAKITTGKSLKGLLAYNEKKVKLGEAKVLLGKGMPIGMEQASIAMKYNRFKKLLDLNRRTKTNTVHISLNFSVKDRIDDQFLAYIANEYMDLIGFGSQPWMVYRHYDAGHPHIHIVTVNVDAEGKRIETHNLGKNQSEKARKELEIELGLIKAEDQKKDYVLRAPLQKAEYGVAETKSLISTIVTEVFRTYSFQSFAAYNATLSQFKVEAVKAGKKDKDGNQTGLLYFILDKDGNRTSVPVKASAIHSRPTLSKILKKIEVTPKPKPDRGMLNRLEASVKKVQEKRGGLMEFKQELQKNAICFRPSYTAEGKLFGTTYIDNIQRKAFKGSDLGKDYTPAGLSQLFEGFSNEASGPAIGSPARLESLKQVSWPSKYSAPNINSGKGEIDLESLAYAISWKVPDQVTPPDPFKKRRKKKKKNQS